MPQQIIGKIPEFTTDETVGVEEVKQTTEETVEEEKETPSEPPAEEQPAEEVQPSKGDDTAELQRAVQGLQGEREKLLREIQALRGQRREIKEEELTKVEKTLDSLTDLNPEDVSTVERILRSKGYVTKQEAHTMFYESVKQEQIDAFIVKYPEYKPENDPNNLNWGAIEREIQEYYRMPKDPHRVGDILEKAHKALQRPGSGLNVAERQHRLETASVGSKTTATRQPSSEKTLNPRLSSLLRTHMQGWSEEEIKQMEQNLEE